MRRTYKRDTKARLSFSGGPHAPVNRKNRKKLHFGNVCCAVLRYISYAKFSQILEVLQDFHRLFGSRNSPTTDIFHTIREAKSRFGADCETRV